MTHLYEATIIGFLVAMLLFGLVQLSPAVTEAPDLGTQYAIALIILAGCLYFVAAIASWKQHLAASKVLLSRGVIAPFMAAIVLVGMARFSLTAAGAPDEVTKYASMTVVMLAGCLYFGAVSQSWKELLPVSYLLLLPYMAVEVAGIGYQWATGNSTIFHAPEYSLGFDLDIHFWGHLVGGLTWEPLSLFVGLLVVHAIARIWTLARRRFASASS